MAFSDWWTQAWYRIQPCVRVWPVVLNLDLSAHMALTLVGPKYAVVVLVKVLTSIFRDLQTDDKPSSKSRRLLRQPILGVEVTDLCEGQVGGIHNRRIGQLFGWSVTTVHSAPKNWLRLLYTSERFEKFCKSGNYRVRIKNPDPENFFCQFFFLIHLQAFFVKQTYLKTDSF